MRTLFLFLSLSIVLAAPALAEENMSKLNVWETPAKRENSAYTEKMAETYKKDEEIRNTIFIKRTALLQKLTAFQGKKINSSDPAERAKYDAELLSISKELGAVMEESSKHDVDSAERNLELAKDRLERAKKNLAFIQEQNKKMA